jgi:NADPH2:quinone reductase
VEIDPRDTMTTDSAVLGMLLWNTPSNDKQAIHAALAESIKNGTIRPIIGKEMSLAEASVAHQTVMQPGAYGKIVLIP